MLGQGDKAENNKKKSTFEVVGIPVGMPLEPVEQFAFPFE
jgi:hypothetical protein